jgi:hypothetical protein
MLHLHRFPLHHQGTLVSLILKAELAKAELELIATIGASVSLRKWPDENQETGAGA